MLLFLLSLLPQNETIPMDEVYFRFFNDAISRESRVYLSISGASSNMSDNLVMFDFKDRMVTIAGDPRDKRFSIGHLTWDSDQLVAVDDLRRVITRYTPDLVYLSKANLDDMDWGSAKGMRTRFFHAETAGTSLITLQKPEDRGQIALARVDFSNMTISVLTHRTIDSKQEGYWLSHQGKLLFVYVNRGQIDLVNATTFKTEKTIREGIDPVKKTRFTKPWRPPYHWVLHYPHQLDGHLRWATKEIHDPVETVNYRRAILKLSPDGTLSFHENRAYPLAIFHDEALVIDWDGPELKVIPAADIP